MATSGDAPTPSLATRVCASNTGLPSESYTSTWPLAVPNSTNRPSGDHSHSARVSGKSFPHSRFPPAPPTMTCPSSYAMHIFSPSADQRMSTTTLLFRLLIISSYHMPLCSIQTMIKPFRSDVVNLSCRGFQSATTTDPLCPSRVWFMERFAPCCPPFTVALSILSTLSMPSSPPHAIQPCECEASAVRRRTGRRESDGRARWVGPRAYLRGVPGGTSQVHSVGNGDLLAQIDEHRVPPPRFRRRRRASGPEKRGADAVRFRILGRSAEKGNRHATVIGT